MSSSIWMQCARKFRFSAYAEPAWRVVEAQHVIATRKLVDSDEEQVLLEELIDQAKPPLPQPYDAECAGTHYLLWTPFRYPPLKHGSRFGSPDRRGLWYGSENLETAFAEKAYYTFLLREGSEAELGIFQTALTTFRVPIKSTRTADLTQPPFKKFEKEILDPTQYLVSQSIGSELEQKGAEVIRFRSARCPEKGANVCVLKISAFAKKAPTEEKTWFCISSRDTVEFKPAELLLNGKIGKIGFPKKIFQFNSARPPSSG